MPLEWRKPRAGRVGRKVPESDARSQTPSRPCRGHGRESIRCHGVAEAEASSRTFFRSFFLLIIMQLPRSVVEEPGRTLKFRVKQIRRQLIYYKNWSGLH